MLILYAVIHETCSDIAKRLAEGPYYICLGCKAELCLKWMSTARCLMWKPLSAIQVICCAPVGGLWQCHCCQMLWGLRKVQETLACLNHQTPLTQDPWQDYGACVRSAMLHGSETWVPKEPELRWLCRNSRWICVIRDRRNTLRFTATERWCRLDCIGPLLSATQMVRPCTTGHVLYEIYHRLSISRHCKEWKAFEDIVWICEDWCLYVWPSWRWPTRQRCMGNWCST